MLENNSEIVTVTPTMITVNFNVNYPLIKDSGTNYFLKYSDFLVSEVVALIYSHINCQTLLFCQSRKMQ